MADLSFIQPLKKNPKVPDLFPGDTVKVNQQIKEGDKSRTQAYQGVVISRGGAGPAKCFTVRRISYGVGVEKSFLVYSPLLESVEVIRRGSVRRAKLSYLRGLSARDSRIKEKARPLAEAAGAGTGVPKDVEPIAVVPAAPVAESK